MADLEGVLDGLIGGPLSMEVLKDKPGRRRTVRARGPGGTVIVKGYASPRAPLVAQRVDALSSGPAEPQVPRVLLVDGVNRLVVLSEVPGRPLALAVAEGDLRTCTRVGAALGRWHRAWWARTPPAFRSHGVQDELATLSERADQAPAAVARAVADLPPSVCRPWPFPTVVHRDLYEEQVVVAGRVGLIDLDDAAAGPPELDLGNLLAHLDLFARRRRVDVREASDAIRSGYRTTGPPLDAARLEQCRYLSELRLAAIHATTQGVTVPAGPSPGASLQA